MLRAILKSSLGVSLVETLLSLSLLSLASLAVLPDWDTSEPAVHTAAIKLANDIRYAQHRAIVTGLPHGFRTLSSNVYEVYEVASGTPILDPATSQNFVVDMTDFFRNINFADNYQVEFNYIGRPTTGGGLTVTLNNQGASRDIPIENETGYVTLPF